MLRKMSKRFQVGVEKYLPDAMILAVLLTLVILIIGIVAMKETPLQMLIYWYDGFYGFLGFSMQMSLILVFGYALAKAPIISRCLYRIAALASTPKSALITLMLVVFVLSWVNWGIGMIAGPLLAFQYTRRMKIDFPILIAASYTAWQAGMIGIGSSIALTSATPGHMYEDLIGVVPVTETIFAPMFLVTLVLGIAVSIFLFVKMMPSEEESFILTAAMDAEMLKPVGKPVNFADACEKSKIIKWITCIMGFVVIIWWFATSGFDLSLDIIIFILLFVGIAMHRNIIEYVQAINDAAKSVGGIILQFPFYAGMQGMIASSGLGLAISDAIISVSNQVTLPLFTYLMAAVVNFFVPSTGGIWGVQGGITCMTFAEMGLPGALAVNSFSLGEIVSNTIQPFWALPMLGVAGLKIKDIWGYCFVAFVGLLIIWGICTVTIL